MFCFCCHFCDDLVQFDFIARGFGLEVVGGRQDSDGWLRTFVTRVVVDGPADKVVVHKGRAVRLHYSVISLQCHRDMERRPVP